MSQINLEWFVSALLLTDWVYTNNKGHSFIQIVAIWVVWPYIHTNCCNLSRLCWSSTKYLWSNFQALKLNRLWNSLQNCFPHPFPHFSIDIILQYRFPMYCIHCTIHFALCFSKKWTLHGSSVLRLLRCIAMYSVQCTVYSTGSSFIRRQTYFITNGCEIAHLLSVKPEPLNCT